MTKKAVAAANGAKPIGPYSTAIENGDRMAGCAQVAGEGGTHPSATDDDDMHNGPPVAAAS